MAGSMVRMMVKLEERLTKAEDEVKRLRAENQQLREQLARAQAGTAERDSLA